MNKQVNVNGTDDTHWGLYDDTLQVVHRGKGLEESDYHELRLTGEDTVLLTAYKNVTHPTKGKVNNCCFEERSVKDSQTLFKWCHREADIDISLVSQV
jgi:hypothetical protein